MKCKHIQQQLLDYSEEGLAQHAQGLVETHLQQCPACRQELRELEQTVHLVQAIPSEDPSEAFWNGFTTDVMRKVKQMDPPAAARPSWFFLPQFRMAAAMAVAIFFLVLGGVLFRQAAAPPPPERLAQEAVPAVRNSRTALQTSGSAGQMFEGIASDELLQDVLEHEFAIIEGDSSGGMYRVDYSDDMLYFLISTLTEEEKDQLLTELYKMK